jgi:DNA invertase Pin-like site-specific DNA recombinase
MQTRLPAGKEQTMQAKIDALYARLSQEDMRAGESESIQNQKLILQKYADEHHFFNTKVYIDDGVSGVSFEREGLQAMLADIEAGRVKTVIVKDLSRLGRNYLKTGELIELFFPEHGVRFIAINDGVDTAREDNDFTPLRNWFNEFYARDTSKKIRAVKQAKAQRCLEGNGVANPTELHYRRGNKARHPRPAPEDACLWTGKSIYGILVRREYRGHTVTAKTEKVSYKSSKTRRNPEEKRYFFEGTHEPLVDETLFSGLLFCADCGHKMQLQRGGQHVYRVLNNADLDGAEIRTDKVYHADLEPLRVVRILPVRK